MKQKTKTIIRNILKWGSLACFLTAVSVIFIEAAMPVSISAGQSNDVAGAVQDELDKNHDKETIKDIKSFKVNFIDLKETFFVGETLKFDIEYTPVDTSYKNLTYSISDSSILSLNSASKEITFKKQGKSCLTVTSEKNPKLSNKFDFEVKNVEPTSVKILSKIGDLNIGDTKTINYEILPANTTLNDVAFTSSNPNVISVDKNGTIKALKGGTSVVSISLSSYPNLSHKIEIKVLEEYHEKVSSISIAPLSLYSNESKDFYLEYFPISSTINLSDFKLKNSNNKLTFKPIKIDRSKGRIYFKLGNKINVTKDALYPLDFVYNDLIASTSLTIKPQEKLNKNLINYEKLKKIIEGKILDSTYYSLPSKYVEEIEINIPYTETLTKNTAKYTLNGYKVELSDDLKLISSKYNKLIIKKNNDTPGTSEVKFYFDKNNLVDFISFQINYKLVTSDEHIKDITLTKFNEGNEATTLFLNHKYTSIFNHKISTISTSEYIDKTLSSSQIDIDVPLEYKDYISLEKDKNNNVISITPLKLGEAKLIVTSRLENSLNAVNKVKKVYKINITNLPNTSYLTIDSQVYDKNDFVFKKGEAKEIKLNFEFVTHFKDKTNIIVPVNDSKFKVEFDSNDIISFNKDTFIFSALSGGALKINFIPIQKELINLSKSLTLTVDHIAINIAEFKPTFDLISSQEFNKPNKDFSIIPIGTSFKVGATFNSDATNKNIIFSSSSKEIISIDAKSGEAKAIKKGKSTISIVSADDPNIKITKNIDVIETSSPFTLDKEKLNALKFEEIVDKNNKFSHYHISLNYGQSYSLKIKASLANASSKDITYTFVDKKSNPSDTTIISIDESGNILTKNIGSTWVKITYGSSSINQYSKFVNFEVYRDKQLPFKEMAYKLRKLIGHFGLFAATAISGLCFIFLQFKNTKLQIVILVVYSFIGFLVSFISEVIQGFIPGRYYTMKDVMLNTFGFTMVTFSLIALLIIIIIINHFIKKKENAKTLSLILRDDKKDNE